MNIPILDIFLNGITTYRLVLYSLVILFLIATVFGFLDILPYNGFSLFFSAAVLVSSCYVSNLAFSNLLKAPTNFESPLITGFLLFCILTPIAGINDVIMLVLSAIIAMASKYVIAIHKKHIFNPTALAVFVIGFLSPVLASWWICSNPMRFFIIVLGFIVLRKVRQFQMFFTYLFTSIIIIVGFSYASNTGGIFILPQVFTSWPTVFFGTFMLTEPQTLPPRKKLRMIYAMLVGVLSSAQYNIGPIFPTPQLALIIGNIFSYIVSPKTKLFLHLKEKVQVSSDMYNFIFGVKQVPQFLPGQYMEFTLSHKRPDSRGTRRYFTIASSPTEKDIVMGVRISSKSSSYKNKLSQISKADSIVASQLAGDFVLPENTNQKLVFLAGGIGITPFRSMVQYVIDTKQKRNIVLLYSAKTVDEFAYKETFDKASSNGVKTFYTVTDKNNIPKNWKGYVGRINEDFIKQSVPDFKERYFYLSGPQAMVVAFEKTLKKMGAHSSYIKKDFFPGF